MKAFVAVLALAIAAPAPTPMPRVVLSAVLLDGTRCHLPPAMVITYTDGSISLSDRAKLPAALKAAIQALPNDRTAVIVIPCQEGASTDDARKATQAPASKTTPCQAIVMQAWRTYMQGSEDTFCSQI
jgi:hypothetical protein